MDHSEVKHFPKVDHQPAELDRVSRLLLKAADIMEVGGHCKGMAQDGAAHCLSGAVSQAAFGFGSWGLWHGHNEAFERVRASIEDPISWNDDPARTKDEVVAKLRAVALSG